MAWVAGILVTGLVALSVFALCRLEVEKHRLAGRCRWSREFLMKVACSLRRLNGRCEGKTTEANLELRRPVVD